MRRLGILLAVGTLLAAAAPARAADVTPQQASALGTEAYLYGFPLQQTRRVRRLATSTRCPDDHGRAPVNRFSVLTRFATPEDRTVVAPNVDTLYSVAHLDLGKGPVVLSHPAMGRRYFVYQLLDPWTNTFAYVGSRTTGSRAGRFAITWRGHGRRVKGAKRISSPSRRVWVIGRTLATDAGDRRAAVRLMRRARLVPPGGAQRLPRDCGSSEVPRVTAPTGLAFLRELNQGLREDGFPKRDAAQLRRLRAIGVGPRQDPARAGLSPEALQAAAAGVNAARTALPAIALSSQLQTARAGGGWAEPADDIGDYGTDYRYRAGVALLGLGANTREEATYPTAFLDAAGQPLTGRRRYRIVFAPGQEPPQRAFWSLTAYTATGFLAANSAGRYAVGSTHPPLRRRADGAIEVVVSRTAPSDPSVNWLPVPAGRFRLNLRLYEPKPAALDGRWRPPPVEPLP